MVTIRTRAVDLALRVNVCSSLGKTSAGLVVWVRLGETRRRDPYFDRGGGPVRGFCAGLCGIAGLPALLQGRASVRMPLAR